MDDIVEIIIAVLGVLALVVVVAMVSGALTMFLWNLVVPELFGLPRLGFGQAMVLLLLANTLFGGFTNLHRKKE